MEDPLEIVVDRFDSPEGLLAVLRGDPARSRTVESLRAADPALPERREVVEIRIDWKQPGPVMVRSGARGLIIDTLPLTTRVDARHLTLVLPGSSIKGALRGHAELIERTARGIGPTVGMLEGKGAARHSAAFRERLDELPAVRDLFGAARGDGDDGRRRAGSLRVEECTALPTIPEEFWRSVTGADSRPDPDDEERPRLADSVHDRLEDLGMEQSDHVALDRWTGGAADGLLFSVLEPYDVEWEPIRLTVDLTRLREAGDRALALLLLTLRDLAEGRITLGAATNRGIGDVGTGAGDILLSGGPWPEPVTLSRALTHPRIAQAWTRHLEEAS
ncbi:hypothetical protein C1I98_31420 [Spongiactinospora gelatinilytica]|uniref:CRISPR type III-associated protein domain-containing protein n=1 Tax=Spongiactinospora gelatinilytica TaxID=2666298 RepID=A0A2W2F1N0_9ACTN|nr:hypothetical protein C1I98_31420 [Spongiactinospora gelatinilytica]